MTTKKAIIATLLILVVALGVGLLMLFLFVDPNTRAGKARAALLGQGMAILSLVPIGIIWFAWALRVRKARDRAKLEASHLSGPPK